MQQGQCQEQQPLLQPPGAFSKAPPGCLQPPSFLDLYNQQLAAALQAGALCVTSSVTSGTTAGDTALGTASLVPHPGLIYSSAWGPAPVQLQPHAAGGHSGVYRGMVTTTSDSAPQVGQGQWTKWVVAGCGLLLSCWMSQHLAGSWPLSHPHDPCLSFSFVNPTQMTCACPLCCRYAFSLWWLRYCTSPPP
jgi:hypothetical protein